MTLPLILFGIAALVSLVGGVLLLVASFRVSLIWGLVSLLVPFGLIVFTCVHWSAARLGFFIQLAALPFCVGGVILISQQDSREIEALFATQLAKAGVTHPALAANAAASGSDTAPLASPSLPRDVYQTRKDANQRRFTELATVFTRLTARRNTLDPKNPEVIRAFNDDVALYSTHLKEAQVEKQQIEALRPPEVSGI